MDGKRIDSFPMGRELTDAKPIVEYVDGWGVDITGCRKFEELPENAQKYVKYLEKVVEAPVSYVSVGAERDQIIVM